MYSAIGERDIRAIANRVCREPERMIGSTIEIEQRDEHNFLSRRIVTSVVAVDPLGFPSTEPDALGYEPILIVAYQEHGDQIRVRLPRCGGESISSWTVAKIDIPPSRCS